MDAQTKAALIAGAMTGLFVQLGIFFEVYVLGTMEVTTFSWNFYPSLLFGVVGATISFLLLFLLIPVYKRCSKIFSSLLFIILGAGIPFIVFYFSSTIEPGHGNTSPAPLYGPNRDYVIFHIVGFSLVGLVAALSAWFTINALKDEYT